MRKSRPAGQWNNWKCVNRPDGVHVVPRRDYVAHILVEDCVCGPTAEVVQGAGGLRMFVHHSADGREATEMIGGEVGDAGNPFPGK